VLFEIQQVLIHTALLVPTHESTDRIDPQHCRRIKNTKHELTFLLPNARIVVQHIVKVAKVREPDSILRQSVPHARSSGLIERLS
jgi:hypothetical protein